MITLQERVHGISPPSEWGLGKLHRVLRVRKNYKNLGMQEDNLLSLSYGRIIRRDIDTAEGLLPESFETYQIVEPGNIVMRLTDLQNDKRSLRQGFVQERGIITSAYDALEVGPEHDPRFWMYFLLALDYAKYYYSLGGGVRQSVSFGDFPNDWIGVPDLKTQKMIADFLDKEMSRISTLIEKKHKHIAATVERRTAQINQYLSYGLNSAAARKATVCEFLSEIPGHWSEERLRFSLRSISQGWSPQCENRHADPEEWAVLKVGAVSTGTYRQEEHKALPSSLEPRPDLEVRPGDVLAARASGSPHLVGKAAFVETTRPRLMISDKLYRLTPDESKLLPRYLALVINSPKSRSQIEIKLSSAEGMARNIGQDVLKDLWWGVPPVDEQREIIEILDRSGVPVENAIQRMENSILRLREMEASVVTAAVTGKLNCQTWQRQERGAWSSYGNKVGATK